jgi:hypothetical protein
LPQRLPHFIETEIHEVKRHALAPPFVKMHRVLTNVKRDERQNLGA